MEEGDTQMRIQGVDIQIDWFHLFMYEHVNFQRWIYAKR